MLLAQTLTGVDPKIFTQFMLIAGWVLSIILAIKAGFQRGQISRTQILPDPLSVKAADTFATRQELQEVKEEVQAMRAELRQGQRGDEERAVALHNRINPVTENLAEIKGRMEAFSDAIRAFQQIAECCTGKITK